MRYRSRLDGSRRNFRFRIRSVRTHGARCRQCLNGPSNSPPRSVVELAAVEPGVEAPERAGVGPSGVRADGGLDEAARGLRRPTDHGLFGVDPGGQIIHVNGKAGSAAGTAGGCYGRASYSAGSMAVSRTTSSARRVPRTVTSSSQSGFTMSLIRPAGTSTR